MFYLRTLTPDGDGTKVKNQTLGEKYEVIGRETNYNDFRTFFENLFEVPHVADMDISSTKSSKNCFGIIVSENEIVPLYKDNAYYVMTGSGSTFESFTNGVA